MDQNRPQAVILRLRGATLVMVPDMDTMSRLIFRVNAMKPVLDDADNALRRACRPGRRSTLAGGESPPCDSSPDYPLRAGFDRRADSRLEAGLPG